jgi:hypothetical protein
MTFIQALGLIALVNIAVRVLPFRRLAAWLVRGRARPAGPCDPARLAAIVARASACCWPAPSCLTRSLVLCHLLVRRGADAHLVLGVNTRDGQFAAHAWVEHDGRTVHEEAQTAGRFTELCRFHDRAAVIKVR